MNEIKLDDTCVRKITFSRDLNDQDFRDMREVFGHSLVQEGRRHIVVAFENEMAMRAFKALAESGFYTR